MQLDQGEKQLTIEGAFMNNAKKKMESNIIIRTVNMDFHSKPVPFLTTMDPIFTHIPCPTKLSDSFEENSLTIQCRDLIFYELAQL
jgi:hypothetical protein